MNSVRRTASILSFALLCVVLLHAQGTAPVSSLTLVSRDGRRPVPTTVINGQELIALDDVASLFQVAVREDALGITVTSRGRTIVVSPDQPMASVNGRVVALPSAAVRVGRRWLVPLDFLPRALAAILDTRIDLRRQARLLLVGDVNVPRVAARIDTGGPPTRATIEITPATPVRVTREGNRVVARIEADALDIGASPGGAGLIDDIRAGEQPTMVVVVLDERAGMVRFTPTDAGGVTRVAIEVAAAGTETATPAPAPPAPAPAPAESPAPPALAASRSAIQTIVVDPGHGGDDVGVRGRARGEEKQITLQVARRLRTLIEMRLGVRVLLTHDDDKSLSLDDRAAVANNSKADVFLSLHMNSAPSPRVAGAEVFHLRLDREGEEARQDAATDAVALPVLGGSTRTIDVIRWDLAQVRHLDQSAALASMLEDGLRKAGVPMAARPRQQAPLRVLTSVNMPAALVEMGYLTNADQERRARTDEYQNAVAQGLYEAIVRFRDFLEQQRLP